MHNNSISSIEAYHQLQFHHFDLSGLTEIGYLKNYEYGVES